MLDFRLRVHLFARLIKRAQTPIRLLLSVCLLYSFHFGWMAPASAEIIATYADDTVESSVLDLSTAIHFDQNSSFLAGLENTSMTPFIASGEFLMSNEVIAWFAANTTLALMLAHIYNQQGQTLQGMAVAGGMAVAVPMASWLLLLGAFFVGFTCGGGYAAADCTIPYSIAGVLIAGAIVLPIAAFFLGLSWLPAQNSLTSNSSAMIDPAFKMQLIRF